MPKLAGCAFDLVEENKKKTNEIRTAPSVIAFAQVNFHLSDYFAIIMGF
jgi:hypothetical protein